MFQRKIRWLFGIASVSAVILLTIQTLAASPVFVSPPNTVEIAMHRLQSNGRIYESTPGIPATCATPENQDRWGCTAFDVDQTLNFDNAVVPYPYGNVFTPGVAFETDYLMDVVPQEMSVDPAEAAALQAQAVAARTYAMNGTDTGLDNSTNDQVFVPYRFDFLRVEGGDTAHNPQTTPTPDVTDCSTIPATGSTRYQWEVCDAVNETYGVYVAWYTNGGWDDAPAFTEFFADAVLQTVPGGYPYLESVDDPISRPAPEGDATTNGHGRGLSTRGAIRWAKGDTCAYGACSPWSVTWNDYRQILVHYYTGIDIGQDAGGWFQPLAPDDRWNGLDYSSPTEMENNQTYALTLVVQNTSVRDWDQSIELTYQWTAPGASPYENGEDAWQTVIDGLPLAIGATATLTVAVTAPNDVGLYDLHWDFVRRGEGSIWFGAPSPWRDYAPWPHLTIPVTVTSVGTPTPTPIPTSTNTPTPTPTPRPTFTPSATPTPTATPSPTDTPTVPPTPTPVTPTSTPKPCAAQVAAQDEVRARQTHILGQLYRIRDRFLVKEANGQSYIELYYTYSPEVAALLLKNPSLRQQARRILVEMLPVAEPLTNPAARPLPVTKEQVMAMDRVLAALQKQAGPELAKEIGWWREQMKEWPGLTAPEIWEKTSQLRP